MAFSLAAAVALSDDHVSDAETTLIEKLRRYFSIPAARATALLDGALAVR